MIDRKKGCEQCRDFWQFSRVKMPNPICENYDRQVRLYHCHNCKSFWEESQRSAAILFDDELLQFYPELLKKME